MPAVVNAGAGMRQLPVPTSSASAATKAVTAPSGTPPPGAAPPTPPNEGLYGQYQAQAVQAYQQAQAAIAEKRAGIYRGYGFNADGSVDGLNATGGYQVMKHNQALELQGAENSALDRGLGTSGLGAQIAEAPRFQEDADSANFADQYLGALQGNDEELSGAQGTEQQALIQARAQQIADDIANGRYDAAAPSQQVSANAKTTAARLAAASSQQKPGGIVTDKTGGSYNPATSVYTPAPAKKAAATAHKLTPAQARRTG